MKSHTMPLALLRCIAERGVPFIASGELSVDALRTLVLAGYVKATFAPDSIVVVTTITPIGQQWLRCHPPGGNRYST
ncbi:MAG: hypothetical protein KKC85_08880 [Gammaproteobacteria bacterium]|nr:hypothetical protein [Gammaproteobacteria bacterium]MBU1442760.1 hypothetical protein [Gammaproteobacteria bacterium]MBU2286534.1 hypothetical protein [Gammaproteobacteria bacterium]